MNELRRNKRDDVEMQVGSVDKRERYRDRDVKEGRKENKKAGDVKWLTWVL
jgi:hypothetical protein